MRLHVDDLTKTVKEFNSLINAKDKEDKNGTTLTKLTILSLVYGSTLSSTDILELGAIITTIGSNMADKERRSQ
nr:MAG TPA: hypothetical protein [Caudoviricetes sp.]